MHSFDAETLRFYTREAEAYSARPLPAKNERLDLFIATLPAGAKILELGCGGGHDSRMMLARGFDVTPTDGSPEMARQAEKLLGGPVAVLPFDQLNASGIYDAVWANACLLHIPRCELSAVLARIHRALKAGGIFYASFKAGEAEGRDRFQRYYNYPSRDWLLSQYAPLGWMSVQIDEGSGGGYDGEKTEWLHVTAVRAA
ncbi:class I SAM-dependent methyltransferase [Pararhizobium sp. BT-229]|uniref:class I SAM-dependent methyltransferase n=1 Tax=Pararhizobium sp. BT-229 TaxID=2986923 RepID=UPI0021F78904|nr:class I SAM-dependent methyltransferase [Pararhizobium sp. BT-229]MCV9965772.1 class I SAM-dependent methyltransferase [Pararhizobium sp. BT-229]